MEVAGDLLPVLLLLGVEAGVQGQFGAAGGGEVAEEFKGAGDDPGGGDVGVRVVVEAGAFGSGVRLVVLVGAHDAEDAVAAQFGVPGGGADPEPGDLEQHLGALVWWKWASPDAS